MKTTRTGFDGECDDLLRRYQEARAGGCLDHAQALRLVARGLPLHLVDRWTLELRAIFDKGEER